MGGVLFMVTVCEGKVRSAIAYRVQILREVLSTPARKPHHLK